MKRIFVLLFLFSPFFMVNSQVINIDNGFIHTTTKFKANKICNHNSYSGIISIDYFEKKKYYITTQVGYHTTGYYATQSNFLGHITDNHKFISDDLHVSTTVRYKIPVYKLFVYVGLGPKIDFTFNRKKSENHTYRYTYPYTDHFRNMFGGKFDFGVYTDIQKKYRVGINTAYLTNFNNGNINTNKFVCGLSIGYILGQSTN